MTAMIFVTTHKQVDPILRNKLYIPLQVGKRTGEPTDYLGDDTGDHISEKALYSELRGQYWFWKNISCDYIGLVHYRRYFRKSNIFYSTISDDGFETVMDEEDIRFYLRDYDIIVLSVYLEINQTMRGFIHDRQSTIKHEQYFYLTETVISDLTPDYLDSFNAAFDSSEMFPNNMYIASKALSDQYSAWVFAILEEVERRLDEAGDPGVPRLMGCLGEVLLKTWVLHNKLRAKRMFRMKTDDAWMQYKPLCTSDLPYTAVFEKTKDGYDILKLCSPANTLYMGSKYKLSTDIDALLRQTDGQNYYGIIILGLGGGDYLEHLLNALPDTPVVVLEPNADVIRHFIDSRKYWRLCDFDHRLRIIFFGETFADHIGRNIDLTKGYLPVHYTNYNQAYAGAWQRLRRFVQSIAKDA